MKECELLKKTVMSYTELEINKMPQASSKEQYIRAWCNHINEFTRVQLETTNESEVKEISDIMDRLREIVKQVAENLVFIDE